MSGSDKELPSTLSEIDKAYLAGLFDGEGCISATFGTKKYISKVTQKERIFLFPRILFVISNKSYLLLDIIQTMLGKTLLEKKYGNVYRSQKGMYEMWNLRINAQEQILSIVNALIPFVKLKKNGLYIAKDTLSIMQNKHHSKWTKEELIHLHDEIFPNLQKLLPSGKKRGRPFKYSFHEIISKYY